MSHDYDAVQPISPDEKDAWTGSAAQDRYDLEAVDSLSYQSHLPLNQSQPVRDVYPLYRPRAQDSGSHSRIIEMPPTSMPNGYDGGPSSSSGGRPPIRPFHRFDGDSGSRSSRSGSWDLLAGVRKFEHSYDRFDSRNASKTHLAFAEGDLPKNRVRDKKVHFSVQTLDVERLNNSCASSSPDSTITSLTYRLSHDGRCSSYLG